MKANDFDLENAIRNIVGIWHDPLTKDAYRFSTGKNGVSPQVLVLQHALGTPLKFQYQITKDEEGLWLSIDGNKMKVLKLTPYPLSVLTFKSANNNVVSLCKDYASAIEEF